MARPVRMPALGQTSDELRVLAWYKSPGDHVAEGEALLEVETDKTSLEVEATSTGVLLATLRAPGEEIEAGTVIGWIGAPGEPVPGTKPPAGPGGDMSADGPDYGPARMPADPPATGDSGRPTVRHPASPVVRALARQHGIDIDTVPGSGPGGRIERADVLAAVTAGTARQDATTHEDTPGKRAPAAAGREAVARHLSRATDIPQFSISRTVDARRIIEAAAAIAGATYTHVLLQAIGAAAREHPVFNQIWSDGPPAASGPAFAGVNVGLAVDAGQTLIVVAVPDPDKLELAELAALTRQVVTDARAGRVRSRTLAATPVTLSNLGMFDVDHFTPLVGPGQTAVLGAGRVADRPAVVAGQPGVLPQLELTLAVDHRAVDGAAAARFLRSVAGKLES